MGPFLPVVLSLLSQAPAGPEEAFRANFAAIHAEVHYVLRAGDAPAESVDQLRSWSSREVSFVEQPRYTLNIDWACDGVAQRIACLSANPPPPPELSKPTGTTNVPQIGLSRGGPAPSPYTAADRGFEVLWDGEIQVEHRLDQTDAQLHLGDDTGILYTTGGPFLWWANIKYPAHLKSEYFPKCVPTIHPATLGGRGLVVAVYEDEFEAGGWARLDVWHDPSVGFLPRFARYVVGGPPGDTCKEYFLIDAQPCASGGFVPTLVYEASFDIDRPSKPRPAGFDSKAPPPVARSKILMRRLEAIEFKNAKGPAGLEKLDNVKVVASRGGALPLRTKTKLTIEAVKAMFGRKLTDPVSARLPPINIDAAELNEYSEPPRSHWLAYSLGIALAFAIGAGGLWRWTRARTALAIVALAGVAQPGCSPGVKGVPGLTGAFDQTRVLYGREQSTIPLTMSLRNTGTVPLRLMNVDGGCSCRHVDTTVLPRVVLPGQICQLHVDMTARSLYGNEHYLFRAQTDRGSVDLPIGLVLFPRNRVSPESVGCPTLVDDGSWEFTLVHRAVFEATSGPPELAFRSTPEFDLNRVDVQRGQVAVASEFAYEDTTYRIVLKDTQHGLRKSVLTFRRPDDVAELEIPVVWRRVAYLSAVPDRAYLGPRPFRVFLRFPDERVELTRVCSAPAGVKAVVSSPREVTVMLADAAPPVVDGIITVETTDKGRPPLRFPVVRYSLASDAKNAEALQ